MKNHTLLIKNATVLVTMDDHRREIRGGGLFVRDGIIEMVGEFNIHYRKLLMKFLISKII